MKSSEWLLSKLKENINSELPEDVFYKRLIDDLCKEILKGENLQQLTESLKSFDKKFSNQPPDEVDNYLQVKGVCEFLGISRITLYNQKNNPHFPKPKRIGRRIIYSKKSLIEYLNRIKNYNREPP